MVTTDCWVDYTRYSSSSLLHQHSSSSSCSLMKVIIFNNRDSFSFPCFSCSGFDSASNYHNDFRQCLTDAISNAVVLPSPNCAAAIAEDVLFSVLLLANYFYADQTHVVEIRVIDDEEEEGEEEEEEEEEEEQQEEEQEEEEEEELEEQQEEEEEEDLEEDDVNRVVGESFEEEVPRRKPCMIESVIKMVMERAELEALEGEKAEKDWKESGSHDCVICVEEIESVWDSLKSSCSHVFHERCLLRWLNDNHVCPLCRFKLPLENDA